tara:strand:+ start:19 stop:609 length:591 start_codon:yes stop_codon:yes gene_type:complete
MFAGIIQGVGNIDSFENNNLYIRTFVDLSDCKIGSSISCNGVCLTATSIKRLLNNEFIFSTNISEETINRSTFNSINISDSINIEKSLKYGDEISGHFVYGHVDCITEILKIEKLTSSWNFEFKKNDEMQKFIVQKGSISINGISLTIAKVLSKSFYISIIPHTYDNTNLNKLKLNDSVNIEFDALARYIYNNEKS